jgi:hypothetical protein
MFAEVQKDKADDSVVTAGGKPVEVVPFQPPKFEATDPAAFKYLDDHGYVVFRNIATQEELQQGKELFWKFMGASFPAIKRDNISTWGNDNWPKWADTGIIDSNGIGNSEFTWFCRGIPKIKDIFTTVWDGNDDLFVSMDATGVTRPLEYDPIFVTRGGWFHFDQNGYVRKGRHCVQGLLNFLPSGPKDGGLVVIPKTHNLFDNLFASRDDLCDKRGSDFVKITKPGLVPEIWDNPEYYPIKLCLDPGDFVLWDSRTAHCNHPASPLEKLPKVDIRRLVCYVCMTPTSHASKSQSDLIAERLGAFRDGLTTSHWPHEFQPRGKACHSQPEFFLNKHQKELLVGKTRVGMLGDGPLSSKNVPLLQ